MFIAAGTLDDLMMESIQAIQLEGDVVEDSSRG